MTTIETVGMISLTEALDIAADVGKAAFHNQRPCPFNDPHMAWAFDPGHREAKHMSTRPPDIRWRFRMEEEK